ncbi:MAG: hypothetical protein IJD48_01420 [Clostridia bacterium]|nr:hypothetical protein [Clostridia bacterium]
MIEDLKLQGNSVNGVALNSANRSDSDNPTTQSIFYDNNDVAGEINCDGKIEGSKQGQMGDCYLLAAINGIAAKDPDFFKDIIKDNGDTIEVSFKGVKDKNENYATYSISKEDLAKLDTEEGEELKYELKDEKGRVSSVFLSTADSNYANGDDDVLALEAAYKALRKDVAEGKITNSSGKAIELDGNKTNIINSGYIEDAYSEITGKYASTFRMDSFGAQDLLETPENYSSVIGFSIEKTNSDKECVEVGGLKLPGRHGYTITKIDKNGVSFINPHDSTKEMTLSMDDFKSVADTITYDYQKYSNCGDEMAKSVNILNSDGLQEVDVSNEVQELEKIKEEFYNKIDEAKNENLNKEQKTPVETQETTKENKSFFEHIADFFGKIGDFFKQLFD